MALRNHDLDDKIVHAALQEFLDNGYEKASLRKIASAAGVTIGAIYTRYPTKDQLFCSLVQPLTDRIQETFQSLKDPYGTQEELPPAQLARSMQLESQAIVNLLFEDYDRAVLLLCRSTGSSLETFLDTMVEQKIQDTLSCFQAAQSTHPSEGVLRLLISGQYHMYSQILSEGCDLSDAKERAHAAMIYHTGGWLTLLRMQSAQKADD